jgi:SAM-dependent methyltransferase
VKAGYLAGEYGYELPEGTGLWRSLGSLLRLFPGRRLDVDEQVRFLQRKPQGRLLDVGCGSGDWLLTMRELGWQVEGLDFDAAAAGVARERGLTVRCGVLEQQQYASDSFDAVTMNHVIEHVADPLGTLRHCARVLKRHGQFVLFTPNTRSLGHRVFKEHWRGLEPPRHLHLFCPQAIESLFQAAGFEHIRVRTLNASYVWRHSWGLWKSQGRAYPGRNNGWVASAATAASSFCEHAYLTVNASVGECLGVQATKLL